MKNDTCTCGHKYRLEGKDDADGDVKGKSSMMLDASFVHLPNASSSMLAVPSFSSSKNSSTATSSSSPAAAAVSSSSASLPRPQRRERSSGSMASAASPNSSGSQNFPLHYEHLRGGGGGGNPAGLLRDEHGHCGFLKRYHYLHAVEHVSRTPPMEFSNEFVKLCPVCIERVERAMIADTERLEREIQVFQELVREEVFRSESWKRACEALSPMVSASDHGDNDDEEVSTIRSTTVIEQQENAFRSEIELFRHAVSQQEFEIARLVQLQKDQTKVLCDLRQAQRAMEEERNNLELEARAFDNDHHQLSRMLVKLQGQVDRLSSPQIRLLRTMFELTVDKERGLRYPMINELRLAYRPKGDVQWEEIQGAWSLAAQLLLSVATVFQFQSLHWKIVPLSHCAKLIYTEGGGNGGGSAESTGRETTPTATSSASSKIPTRHRSMVFNLGHHRTDGSRALMAWNALLHKVIQHTTVQMHQAAENGLLDSSSCTSLLSSLPYEISPHQIGDVILARLDVKDDAAWSKVIHCMASNLLWLSECASAYVHQTTLVQAAASCAT